MKVTAPEEFTSNFAVTNRAIGRTEGRSEGRTEGLSEGRTEGLSEGKVEEARKIVLLALDTRGLAVSGRVRTRVGECRDLEVLETWIRRAMTADTADEVFA